MPKKSRKKSTDDAVWTELLWALQLIADGKRPADADRIQALDLLAKYGLGEPKTSSKPKTLGDLLGPDAAAIFGLGPHTPKKQKPRR